MSSHSRALGFLLALGGLLVSAGCGGGEYRKQEVYYLVAANINLPYWQSARNGLFRAAAELGVSADVKGPETYDPKAQREEFLKLVAMERQPAGILVSPASAELMKDAIDQAVAKGIKVITIDSDAPGSKRLFFVGTDNYDVGFRSAEYVAQRLNRAGNVIIFTIAGQVNLEERLRGYRDAFAAYPAIRIIETVDIKGDPVVAFDRTKLIVAKELNRVDAFACLEAIACPEVAEVLSRNNVRNKVVVAMDVSERTLDWIQKGMIQATFAQRPYTMAYVGLRMLADLHHYPPAQLETTRSLATVPQFVDTGVSLVDRSNVEQFLKDQAAQGEGGSQ
jgi:ribose transport system substrate-binding protein